MAEVDLLDTHPRTDRDYDARAKEMTPEVVAVARQFGEEFFDGDRLYGYGGYRYDGRWKAVAKRLKEHFGLAGDAKILDVGCAKGFLMHDFKELMPGCTVAGIDVSEYAIDNGMEDMKPFMQVASADALPFEDDTFDFVVSINSIHNLSEADLKTALREIDRVCKGGSAKSYITVDAWRNAQEAANLKKWILTAETFMHVDDWKTLFDDVGYKGDYWWFIAN